MEQLPLYQCHKKVRAAKIIGITALSPSGIAAELVLNVPDPVAPKQAHLSVTVDKAWYTRNPKVAVGGYFVQYEDGYTAYSPAEPFEAGYTLIEEPDDTHICGCCPKA